MAVSSLVTGGVGPGSTIPLLLTGGLYLGEEVVPPAATALTGRKVPWRSYRRGRLIDDELYWRDDSQDIGEEKEIVVESTTNRPITPNALIQEQIAAMREAIEEARTDKIRKKRAKDLALFQQRIAEEEEEQEVIKLLFELMQ